LDFVLQLERQKDDLTNGSTERNQGHKVCHECKIFWMEWKHIFRE